MNRNRSFLETNKSIGELVLSEFHTYYVKGRVFEWTFGLAMFFAGLECLIWDNVISFGAFHWMLQIVSQKWIGTMLFFIGWMRISALMFNGQLLFGRRFGWGVRACCAVVAASIWAQFAFALVQGAIMNGVPSIGLPFWTMFTLAELLIAYQVGAEWKK
jgi:hypothetical protein